eukprot:SAG22_NODE_10462_length_534_cov_0.947126_1_plen_53_part_10
MSNGVQTVMIEAKETDPHKLDQRYKQVSYGKNTSGYEKYSKTTTVRSPSRLKD